MTEREILIAKLIKILKQLPYDRLRIAYIAIKGMSDKKPE